ncbi:WD40 repeat domain-containing protein [Streptomyces chrestomyceticus]|uniref:WD40 repeat domain-containing protein n=1 Tax=Streptomyces chrestomyceticus TaxID=68185 RepID=UPI0033F66156
MSTPNKTEFTAELEGLAEELRRLRADRGSPTLTKIVARAAAMPGASSLSVSALSEAFSGKRLQRVDSLMTLVRTLLSYDEDGNRRSIPRAAPEMEVWRSRWRGLDQLRSPSKRRSSAVTAAQPPSHVVSPLALRVLTEDLVRGYALPLTPLDGPAAGHDALAFSPDGRYLALGGSDGAVHLQDPVTGQAVAGPLAGHQGIVRDVAFSPDGRLLASSGDGGPVWLWDMTFRSPVGGSLPDSQGALDSVAFSPDGRLLAAVGFGQYVYLWDTVTREMITTLDIGSPRADALAFSPDGTHLAAATSDGSLRLWSPATWEVTGDVAVGDCCDIAFSPDGNLLASAGADGAVRLWDHLAPVDTVRVMMSASARAVSAVAFSPDGGLLAGAMMDGTVHLWDPTNGQPLSDPFHAPLTEAYAVAFSPDGGLLAAVGHDKTVQRWITPALHAA